MKLATWYSFIAFIHGIFFKIVDDMYDNNLLPKFKFLANVILQLITIYIIFFTKYFGMVWSLIIVFGGIGGMFLARDSISAPPWILTIILGVLGLIYHMQNIKKYLLSLSNSNIRKIFFLILPSLVLLALSQVLEQKLFPEEFSKRKLFERLGQALVFLLFIINRTKIQHYFNLSNKLMQWIIWQTWLGQGYLWTNIITMLILMQKN